MAISEKQDDYIELNRVWTAVKRRWLWGALTFSTVFAATTLFTFWQRPVYQAQAQLLLKDASEASPIGDLQNSLGDLQSLTSKSSPLETEAAIIRSNPIIQEVITSLNLKDVEGQPLRPDAFLKQFNVTNLRGTDLLSLSYNSTDSNEAVQVIDRLIKIYSRDNVLANRAEITAARIFVERQLPNVENRLQNLDQKIRQFKERNQLVDLQAESSAIVNLQAELNKMTAAAQTQMSAAQTRASALRQQVGMTAQQAQTVNNLSQSPGIQAVLVEYQKVEADLAILNTQYQPDHPMVIATSDKKKQLAEVLRQRVSQVMGRQVAVVNPRMVTDLQAGESRQRLVDALTTAEVESLTASGQVAGLRSLLNNYQQRLKQLPSLEQSFRELERQRGIAQATYETLLKSLQNLRLTENQNIGNLRVIQPAQLLPDPVSPRILLNLALGALTGGLLATAVMLILESRDRSVKTTSEIQDILATTVLSSIPRFQSMKKGLLGRNNLKDLQVERDYSLVVRDEPRSVESEAYRVLQTNLKFLNSDKPVRTIAVTSSMPQEGKSTTIANLALAIAEMGQRVLLIDADLRLPSQHQIWGLPNRSGLSSVIAEGLHPQRVIHQISNHLDVLTAGLLPPNPLVLLDSRRMATLLEHLSTTYDYILIDTPPVTVAADALVIGKMADGMMMVVRPGLAETAILKSAQTLLENSGQNLLGVVVNGVDSDKPAYYAGYYSGGANDYMDEETSGRPFEDYSGFLNDLPNPVNEHLNGSVTSERQEVLDAGVGESPRARS